MILVSSDDLWTRLETIAKESNSLKAAVAYVSSDSMITFEKGDILVTDASDETIASGGTSAKVLKSAFKRGAELYSCASLHAKVIVFDNNAYIGSANLSKNSINKLDEIGVISDDPAMISGAAQFIDQIVSSEKTSKIDKEFIERISQIEVRHPQKSALPNKVGISIHGGVTWLVAVHNDARYPSDDEIVRRDNKTVKTEKNEEKHLFWVKKNSTIFCKNVKVGDCVVLLEREKGSEPQASCAYQHVVIQKITEDNNLFSYHYAKNAKNKVSWANFEKMAKKANISGLGKGIGNMRELNEQESRVLFELFSVGTSS